MDGSCDQLFSRDLRHFAFEAFPPRGGGAAEPEGLSDLENPGPRQCPAIAEMQAIQCPQLTGQRNRRQSAARLSASFFKIVEGSRLL
jgi:hypothetical protein